MAEGRKARTSWRNLSERTVALRNSLPQAHHVDWPKRAVTKIEPIDQSLTRLRHLRNAKIACPSFADPFKTRALSSLGLHE